MGQHVGVAVSQQASVEGYLHPAQDQGPIGDQPVGIPALPCPQPGRQGQRSAPPGQHRFRPLQIAGISQLEILVPGPDHPRPAAQALHQFHVVGGAYPLLRCGGVGPAQQGGPKQLGRLGGGESAAVQTGRDRSLLHLFHAVHHRCGQ